MICCLSAIDQRKLIQPYHNPLFYTLSDSLPAGTQSLLDRWPTNDIGDERTAMAAMAPASAGAALTGELSCAVAHEMVEQGPNRLGSTGHRPQATGHTTGRPSNNYQSILHSGN